MAEDVGRFKGSTEYIGALDSALYAGDSFVAKLTLDEAARHRALNGLPEKFEWLGQTRQPLLDDLQGPEKELYEAAGEMQTGRILIVSAEAAIGRSTVIEVREAFHDLAISKKEVETGTSAPLNFLPDLLRRIEPAKTAGEALEIFKARAGQTLDNMVSEAHEILIDALEKFGKTFESFAKDIADLANSFSSDLSTGILKTGLDKIISGLKALAKILKSESLEAALDTVRDAIKGGLTTALSAAYGCPATKLQIQNLALTGAMSSESLASASNEMAALSSHYVGLLKQAKRMLAAIGVAGGILALAAASPHIAALGVPVAYAIVFVATVLIGIDYAKTKMQALIGSL
jgi:hypothetical protein